MTQKFPHRHNKDATHDSICTECLMTVASVESEGQLALFESAHICDPANLYRVSQGRIRTCEARDAISL